MADDLVISSLRGGFNDADPPNLLADDEVVAAENVEFYSSALGERRNGCTSVSLDAAITAEDIVVFLHRHLPTTDETASELWVIAATVGVSVAARYKDTVWSGAVTFTDAPTNTSPSIFGIRGLTLHGKLFLAYDSTVDRLHVRTPGSTNVRRTGLAEPAVPTVADQGAGTYPAITRRYRVRYTEQVAGVTVRRSEPSDEVSFTPSGAGASARVTKPATISEGETHWEVEAATSPGGNFYRIATVAVGTTTYDDSAAPTTYDDTGVLSEDIGDYTLIWSAKYLSADQDRLLFGGSWEDEKLASRVGWTPVNQDPGVGNDERIPSDIDSFLDLDNYAGGGLTGLSLPVLGSWYAFKLSHIYKLVRTDERDDAYHQILLTDKAGALDGSVINAVDENGRGCVYFLNPATGIARIGMGGLQFHRALGNKTGQTWKRINKTASQVICRVVYYQDLKQVKWWVSVDGGNSPSLQITLQTNEVKDTDQGLRGGISLATGKAASAYSATMYADNIDAGTARSLDLRPFIGVTDTNGSVLRLDTGFTDNGTEYIARIKTRPYALTGILNRFGVMAGAILAKAAAGISLSVRIIRDYGREESADSVIDLTPEASEDQVIESIDDLDMSDIRSMQIEFEDPSVAAGRWELNEFALKPSKEEEA